jgi:hypothetical protein
MSEFRHQIDLIEIGLAVDFGEVCHASRNGLRKVNRALRLARPVETYEICR